jgi:hypothetical protein
MIPALTLLLALSTIINSAGNVTPFSNIYASPAQADEINALFVMQVESVIGYEYTQTPSGIQLDEKYYVKTWDANRTGVKIFVPEVPNGTHLILIHQHLDGICFPSVSDLKILRFYQLEIGGIVCSTNRIYFYNQSGQMHPAPKIVTVNGAS